MAKDKKIQLGFQAPATRGRGWFDGGWRCPIAIWKWRVIVWLEDPIDGCQLDGQATTLTGLEDVLSLAHGRRHGESRADADPAPSPTPPVPRFARKSSQDPCRDGLAMDTKMVSSSERNMTVVAIRRHPKNRSAVP